jgi:hypothetical protein
MVFLQRTWNEKSAFNFTKEFRTKPIEQNHRFKEVLRVTMLLPASNIADPNEALKTEWFNNSLLQRSPEVCEKWTLTRQLES